MKTNFVLARFIFLGYHSLEVNFINSKVTTLMLSTMAVFFTVYLLFFDNSMYLNYKLFSVFNISISKTNFIVL